MKRKEIIPPDLDMAGIERAIRMAKSEGKTPAFAYDRVSTAEQQATGYSLDIQKETAAAYAERHGLVVVHAFTIAESSWKKKRRVVFHQMIDVARLLKVHNLIFKNTDRASRNYESLVLLEKLVDNENFTLHFWESNKALNRASNHNDRMILGIEITVAKHHSDKVSDDIRCMIAGKVARGIPPGHPPIGYIYDKKNRIHLKDPETEHVVNFIFKCYDEENLNLAQLRDQLHQRGYRSSRGGKWTVPYLHTVIRNPFYAGYFYHGGKLVKAHHEPYFTLDAWEARIKRMGQKYRSKRRAGGNVFPFAGMFRCHECKRMLSGEIKKGKFMYWSHLHFGEKLVRLREVDIIAHLDEAVKAVTIHPKFEKYVMRTFEESAKTIDSTQERRRQAIRRRLGQITTEKGRVLMLYAKGLFEDSVIEEKINQYRLEESALNREMEGLGVYKFDVMKKIAEVIRTVRGFPEMYAKLDILDKARLLKEQVDAITVYPDHVEITWNAAWRVVLDPELLGYQDTVIKNKLTHARQESNL